MTARQRIRAAVAAVALAAAFAPASLAPAAAQTPTPPPSQATTPEPEGIALSPKPGTPGLSSSGTHFELGQVGIGRPVRGTLIARNLGEKTETADLYGADAVPARGGGFGFTPRGEAPMDVGAWIRLDTKRITLARRQEATVGFTVVVPNGATAGEHIGGVILEPVDPASGGAVSIGTRVAVGVYLTVGGSGSEALHPGLTITTVRAPLRDGRACPHIAYTNSGTSVLDPTAEISVDPLLPGKTKRYPAGKVGGVAPGASIEVDLPCVNTVPFGKSRITVTLRYPGGSAERGTDVNRWPFTVVAAGSILLLLLLGLLWLFFLLKRRDKEEEEEEAEEGDVPVDAGTD